MRVTDITRYDGTIEEVPATETYHQKAMRLRGITREQAIKATKTKRKKLSKKKPKAFSQGYANRPRAGGSNSHWSSDDRYKFET